MHWLLSVPDTFSLREVIRRSGWLLIPSLHAKTMGDRLYRVEDLGDLTVKLDIYQAPAGLVIHTDPHLAGAQIEEASQRAWRMLRLDENLQPFARSAAHSDGMRTVKRYGARLLRGTTLFEDVVTAALATFDAVGGVHFSRVANLVDRLGIALPRNPTLHAFPNANRILSGGELLHDLFGSEPAELVGAIAAEFMRDEPEIARLVHETGPLEELRGGLHERFRLSPPSLSLLLLSVGRYDHIPTDEVAIHRFGSALGGDVTVAPDRLYELFGPFQPWGGLAYWLWDWSKVPEFRAR